MSHTSIRAEPGLRTTIDMIPPERRVIVSAAWEFSRADTGRVVTHAVESSRSPMSLDEFLDLGERLARLYHSPTWTSSCRLTTPG